MRKNFTYKSSDGKTRIHGMVWIPDHTKRSKIRGIVQIVHGIVEFIGRYDRFARFLNDHGYLVIGNDHLGHGASVCTDEDHGFFAEPDGNACLIGDIRKLHRHTREKFPGVPYFIMGHSMGSFLARQYITRFGNELTGAILLGTGYQSMAAVKTGEELCRQIAGVKGWRYRSTVLFDIALGSNNRKIKNPRTSYDWLSHDEAVVDAFAAHPWNTFRFTVNGYYNLFRTIEAASRPANIQMIPFDLPVFIVSGEEDPVGDYGKGVRKVYDQYLKNGITNVSMKLYPGLRHEILNEAGHDVVDHDLLQWLEDHLEDL